MSDGPSAAEMGLTQKDLGIETKQESSKVALPTPPESTIIIWGEPTNSDGEKTRSGKHVKYRFDREKELPPQKKFSDTVKNMILTPMRGELDNGNLANFLRQLNAQKGFDSQEKLGLVLLINDNAKDRDEGKHVVDENHVVSQYVSLLGAKDIEGIGQLDIPQEYKELAQDIIAKDKIEIRQDYLHADQKSAHFGLLRSHLFKEAKAFKNSSLADSEVITHLSDIDVTYTSDHFQTLKNFYSDPSHQANLTEQDFLPGVQEGEKKEDISRDLLSYLDEFRLYRYGRDVESFLRGGIQTGTPIISGRLSYFESKAFYSEMEKKIENEDYLIGRKMRDETVDFDRTVGNVGEVYRGHRARSYVESPNGNARTGLIERDGVMHHLTDAEEAFEITKKIQEGIPTHSGEDEEYIDRLESKASQAKNKADPEDNHSEAFKQSDEYRKLLQDELRQEQAKVRLRRIRLMDYVASLAGNKEIPDTEQKIIDPYREYFQDETEAMKRQLAEGKTPEQVAVSYIGKYDSFFNPDTPIHTQIARLRALKKYTFAHNLKW